MSEPTSGFALGKMMIVVGLAITLIGLVIVLGDKVPFFKNLGRLPGDVAIEKENVKIYFPWVTSLVLSIGLTLAFWLLNRFFK